MHYSDFHTRTRSSWIAAINRFAPSGDKSIAWTELNDIIVVLRPFMGRNENHAHLPTHGGFDFRNVEISSEGGCLDFHVSGRLYATVKPRRLHLERVDVDPAESFLLLELGHLEPSGAYDDDFSRRIAERRQEEVVDLGGANYVSRDGRDDDVFYDGDGNERELPDDYRGVMRFLDGQIMLVAKGSIWNSLSSTYDGVHERLSTGQIRQLIKDLINRRDAA